MVMLNAFVVNCINCITNTINNSKRKFCILLRLPVFVLQLSATKIDDKIYNPYH